MRSREPGSIVIEKVKPRVWLDVAPKADTRVGGGKHHRQLGKRQPCRSGSDRGRTNALEYLAKDWTEFRPVVDPATTRCEMEHSPPAPRLPNGNRAQWLH